MRITSKGQVTIPKKIRDAAGLKPNTDVEFAYDGKTVKILKSKSDEREQRGAMLARKLAERGERLRKAGKVTMTTDEVMGETRGN